MKHIGLRNIMRETGIEIRSVKVLALIAKTLKPSEILACFHRQQLESVSLVLDSEGVLKLKEIRRTVETKKCLVRIVKYDFDYFDFLRHEIIRAYRSLKFGETEGAPDYLPDMKRKQLENIKFFEQRRKETEEERGFQQQRKEAEEERERTTEKQKESVADFMPGDTIRIELVKEETNAKQ